MMNYSQAFMVPPLCCVAVFGASTTQSYHPPRRKAATGKGLLPSDQAAMPKLITAVNLTFTQTSSLVTSRQKEKDAMSNFQR